MKKTLEIGGRKVLFENNSRTPRIYKAQFGRDYFEDMGGIAPLMEAFEGSDNPLGSLAGMSGKGLNLDILENFAWACAATADKSTPDLMEWLGENPEFDRFTDGMEILSLAYDGMGTTKK